MSMTTNKQTLREAAEKANELNPAIGLKEFARRTVDYHASANPATVLALLDELEAAERRNAEHLAWLLTDIESGYSVTTMAEFTLNFYRSKGWIVTPLCAAATDKGE